MTDPAAPEPEGQHPFTHDFDDLKAAEFAAIRRRRGLEPDATPTDLIGLALSGGGIRSASFCLGVLQALDSKQLLRRIDYLSTVSGGGYIGCCLTTCLNAANGRSTINEDDGGYGDTATVEHIRDFSNYLIPRGFGDVVTALGLLLRGLVANSLLVAPVFLISVTLLLHCYPSLVSLQSYGPMQSAVDWARGNGLPFIPGFPATTLLLILVAAFQIAWVVAKAVMTSQPLLSRDDNHQLRDNPEIRGPFVKVWKGLLTLTAISAWLELQPIILAAIASAVPILATCLENGDAKGCGQALLGAWFKVAAPSLAPLATIVGFLSRQLGRLVSERKGLQATSATKRLAAKALIWIAAIVLPSVLWLAYLETTLALMPASATTFTILHWASVASVLIALFVVNPNVTSLHGLYRSRLSKAFLFDPDHADDQGDRRALSPRLHDIDTRRCPYPIVNAALNIGGSAFANKRGRNADFFEFTPEYTGSEATGWVGTRNIEEAEPRLDLATAMAISGAAVSPNMGSATIKPLVPTLALLNIRLGYWLANPARLGSKLRRLLPSSVYFYREIISDLTEKSRTIYVTDGGNIENLGVHALLRRHCKLIIAVDSEADPALTFGALLKLQRYARIDFGTLIDLPWQQIHDHALAVDKAIAEKQPMPGAGPHIAIGTIRYGPAEEGLLVYVKSSLTGDEADYILDYKSRNPTFPHETTGDQFFGEEQLEVYRALGFHIMRLFLDDEVPVSAHQRPGESQDAARRRLTREVHRLLGQL